MRLQLLHQTRGQLCSQRQSLDNQRSGQTHVISITHGVTDTTDGGGCTCRAIKTSFWASAVENTDGCRWLQYVPICPCSWMALPHDSPKLPPKPQLCIILTARRAQDKVMYAIIQVRDPLRCPPTRADHHTTCTSSHHQCALRASVRGHHAITLQWSQQ